MTLSKIALLAGYTDETDLTSPAARRRPARARPSSPRSA